MLQYHRKSAIWAPVFYPAPVRLYLFTIFIAALLAGCQTAVAPEGRIDGVSFKVGENAIGEACRVVSAAPGADLSCSTRNPMIKP